MAQNVMERMAEIDATRKIADFQAKQKQSYEFKVRYAEIRAKEFVQECDKRDLNYHVSVGGLDSITLFLFLRRIGINAPGISVSSLEDISIQQVHRQLGIIPVRPYRSKAKVIQDFGFPVLSKEIASKIELIQNPSPKNATVRHAIITGETGEYGGNRTGTRMKLAQKWLEKFGGPENENEGVNYQSAPFKVSAKCCYYLKEKPCDDWAKQHNSVPFLGLMASEGGRRQKSLMLHGCNYFGESTIRSAPFAIFNRQDLLRLTLEMEEWIQNTQNWQRLCEDHKRSTGIDLGENPPYTIVPEIYGQIVWESDVGKSGAYRTTKAQRTGCSMCGFGIHLEKRPHRFDRLREDNPREWKYWMYDKGWGKVLTYIGVGWEDVPVEQMTLF